MATFKVGDRVRVVEAEWDYDVDDVEEYLGCVGIVRYVFEPIHNPFAAAATYRVEFDDRVPGHFFTDELELIEEPAPDGA